MAYKARMSSDLRSAMFEDQFVDHFWAIHKTVGWGCPNNSDDVALVQYLINVWAKKIVLETDGVFGNKTYRGIKSFQKWMNGNYAANGFKTDGKVSARDGNEYYTKSGVFYTIHALNLILLDERRIYYNDLRMDRELPALLCGVFSAS